MQARLAGVWLSGVLIACVRFEEMSPLIPESQQSKTGHKLTHTRTMRMEQGAAVSLLQSPSIVVDSKIWRSIHRPHTHR